MTINTTMLTAAAAACAAAVLAPRPARAGELEQAATAGTVTLDLRTRYEHAAVGALERADALTVRPRLGYRTGRYRGFDAYAEYEGVHAVGGDESYNSGPPFLDAANGNTVYSTIADPTGNGVNRAWLRYTGFADTTVKLGRQRIIRDDARFVGNVGWRANEQTFDALEVESSGPGDALTLGYAYVWRESFIFFNDNRMDSHLVNVAYEPGDALSLSAYAYLLDFDNDLGPGEPARAPGAPDQRTIGLRAAGTIGAVEYDLQYADQGGYRDAPAAVDAEYYKAELRFAALPVRPVLGFEVAGGDGGYGFQFPLATNHAYFGWADTFLTTPAAGLRDGYVGLELAGGDFSFTAFYHDFSADAGDADYGSELDAKVGYDLGERLAVLAKLAVYEADGFGADTERYWLQATYSF